MRKIGEVVGVSESTVVRFSCILDTGDILNFRVP